MSFGQLIDYLKKLQIFFNKYANLESSILKRKEYYNLFFKTLKNPYLDKSIYLKASYIEEVDCIKYSCPEERIVAENLALIDNHINICNLAYDTRTAMLHEDLDAFIDEKESILLFKGELKSCNKAASYLTEELNTCNGILDRSLDTLQEIIDIELKTLKLDCIDFFKELKEVEQQQHFLLTQYEKEELILLQQNLSGQDYEDFDYLLNCNVLDSIKDLKIQFKIAEYYVYIQQAQKQQILVDNFCASLEELLEDITLMRDKDQTVLLFDIENKLKSLKEFSNQSNI